MKKVFAIASLSSALLLPFAFSAQAAPDASDATIQEEDLLIVSIALPGDENTLVMAQGPQQQPMPPQAGCPMAPQQQPMPPPQAGCPMGPQQQRPDARGPHHMMRGPGDFENGLAVADPEKYAELQKLREQEGKLTKELMDKAKTDREAFKKLVEDYKANPSDDLKAKIREKVASCFDARMKAAEAKAAAMTQKLADAKKDKDATVDKIVENILSGKGPGFGGACPMMRGPGPKGGCPMMKGPAPEGKAPCADKN